ncbi:MAG: plastocyanin/azurin family copper-binding protein [Verrucomicrobiales bacterium]
MKVSPILSILTALAVISGPLCFSQDKNGKVKKQTVKTVEGLRFSPVRMRVKKGETIELKIENHDPNDQPHNFVLIKLGALKEIQAASTEVGPDSIASGYVPQSESVLVKTGLLNPEEEETITFKAPKEPWIYPYVCTFPGHAMIMYGALYVDVKYTKGEAFDTNLPEIVRMGELEKTKEKVAVERPTFIRCIRPDAGPAAIAVALPEELNVCWDAGNCRLRYAWSGGFIDPTRMLNSRRKRFLTPNTNSSSASH